jgi:hypothetical protein
VSPDTIFPPMEALAGITFVVLLLIPFARAIAVRRGQLGMIDFEMGESIRVPDRVALPNRNYMNLLELPLLFYVICLMHYVAGRVDGRVVTLAWLYVAMRGLHSAIHLTCNNVPFRLAAFAASNVLLVLLWGHFLFWTGR